MFSVYFVLGGPAGQSRPRVLEPAPGFGRPVLRRGAVDRFLVAMPGCKGEREGEAVRKKAVLIGPSKRRATSACG